MTSSDTERAKYRRMWAVPRYRKWSPGETLAEHFFQLSEPSTVIDYGTGTGRGAVALDAAGYHVTPLDIADNCLDESVPEYLRERLVVGCLWDAPSLSAEYGYCCDVMEHIPPERVDDVLSRISGECRAAFFSISFKPDSLGSLIGEKLHLTVRPPLWWANKLSTFGKIIFLHDDGLFFVEFD